MWLYGFWLVYMVFSIDYRWPAHVFILFSQMSYMVFSMFFIWFYQCRAYCFHLLLVFVLVTIICISGLFCIFCKYSLWLNFVVYVLYIAYLRDCFCDNVLYLVLKFAFQIVDEDFVFMNVSNLCVWSMFCYHVFVLSNLQKKEFGAIFWTWGCTFSNFVCA